MGSRRLLTAEAEFYLRPVNVKFVANGVALGQVFLQVLRFYTGGIILPVPHIHLYCNEQLICMTSVRSLGTFQQSSVLSGIGSTGQKWTSTLLFKIIMGPEIFKLSMQGHHVKKSATDRCFELEPFSTHLHALPL